MVFVPALGVAQCELRQLYLGEQIENVLYFYLGANPVDSEFEALGEALIGWWSTLIAPGRSDQLSLREVYITDLSGQFAPTFTILPSEGPIPGEVASPALPGNVALALSFRTNGRGRSSRGRNYVAGWTESDVTGNEANVAAANSLQEAYEELMAGNGWTNGEWVVLSRETGGAPRANGLRQLITAVQITDYSLDSQRKRLPGRGR